MGYSREVRLGIVFYGGVSLAIYENGVAQELFHAVHGDGVYGLLKDLIDSDIVLDIISGTSAGGVNGIYLAYALANGKDFTQMSDLWRDKGDIDKLLRSQDDPETKSLLDSRGYYQPELEQAFRSLPNHRPSANSKASALEELDLFVTGTDVYGDIHTAYDDQGHAIDVKEHRAVFRLSWRGSRKNEFKPEYIPELATLARITSCFPVAFEPVSVDPETQPNLARWGRLHESKVFLDGGILDNKPFSYTIDSIFRRTADRPVSRFLLYVEPDPEQFEAPQNPAIPGIGKAAVDALVNIPGYESISADLSSISQHNMRIATMNSLAECARTPAEPAAGCLDEVAVVPSEEDCLYIRARLMQLRDRAIEGILNKDGVREHFVQKEVRRAGRLLVESFIHWGGYGGSSTESLRLFDVYYRLRRLFHVTYAIHGHVQNLEQGEQREAYQQLWQQVNHHIQALEILQWALESYVDYVEVDWKSLDMRFRTPDGDERPVTAEDYTAIASEKWGQVERGLRLVLDSGVVAYPDRADPNSLADFHANLRNRVKQLAKQVETEDKATKGRNLLEESDRVVTALMREWAAKSEDGVVASFCNFLKVDSSIFPLQFASCTHTRDTIQVSRLSPADATRAYSARPLREKVCGKSLGAFGGFFKKPWRSNDIMWGRLDAACQLIECLLTKARASQVRFQNPDMVTRLGALFPQTAEPQLKKLAQDLANIADIPDKQFDALLTELVQAAQEEIIAAEWPTVVSDALTQEREWSQHRAIRKRGSKPPYDVEQLVWTDPSTSPDYLIVQTAATALASNRVPDFSRCKVAGRKFSDEIPGPVLVELGSRAIMRLDKSFRAVAPKFTRLPVVHSTLFGWILPAVHGWSTFHKRAPEWRVASSAALLASTVAVLVVTVLLMRMDIALPSNLVLAFLAGCLAILATWIWAFRGVRTKGRVAMAVLVAALWLTLILASFAVMWPVVVGSLGRG